MRTVMIRKMLSLGTLLVAMCASGLAAAAETNPYILLYEARVATARAEVERARSLNEFFQRVYERDRRLYSERAVSLEELQKAESEYYASLSQIGALSAKINEAEAMVAIVRLRVASGEAIPICTSGG